jgi:hypothetical protein
MDSKLSEKVILCSHCLLLGNSPVGLSIHPALPCDGCLAEWDKEIAALDDQAGECDEPEAYSYH